MGSLHILSKSAANARRNPANTSRQHAIWLTSAYAALKSHLIPLFCAPRIEYGIYTGRSEIERPSICGQGEER